MPQRQENGQVNDPVLLRAKQLLAVEEQSGDIAAGTNFQVRNLSVVET
jgi:hypothetical protein